MYLPTQIWLEQDAQHLKEEYYNERSNGIYEDMYQYYLDFNTKEELINTKSTKTLFQTKIEYFRYPNEMFSQIGISIYIDRFYKTRTYLYPELNLPIEYLIPLRLNNRFRRFTKFCIHLEEVIEAL